jgi:hypothetical protein
LTQFRGAKDKNSKLKTPAFEAVVFGPNGEIQPQAEKDVKDILRSPILG